MKKYNEQDFLEDDNLNEMYENLIHILNNEIEIEQSIMCNLFEHNIVKLLIVLIDYYNLCDINEDILYHCLDIFDYDFTDEEYEKIYNFLCKKWMNKAEDELNSLIN